MASERAIDPQCQSVFGKSGFMTVGDGSSAPAGLPKQITKDDLSCTIAFSSQTIYAYFNDSFTKFSSTVTSFLADGWVVTEVNDAGVEVAFDPTTLPSLSTAKSVSLTAKRGPDFVSLFFVTDATEGQFGSPGFFMIALPLMFQPPPVQTPTSTLTINDPSQISTLRTISQSTLNPAQSGVLVVTSSLLTLLLGIPAYLLSTVLSARYEQWFGWLDRGRIGRFRERLNDDVAGKQRWLFLSGGMVLASFIACFVDPQFGLNGMSVRMFLTFLVSFVVFNVGCWAAINAVLRRVDPAARADLHLHPATLVAVALGVLLSRLFDFNPGLVFGLIAGFSFAVTLALSREVLVVLVGSGFAAAAALVAWVGYSVMQSAGPPSGAGLVGLSEFFGGITLEGVSALPIALLPLAALEGATVFHWKRWVWAVSYAGAIGIFMFVLFAIPGDNQPIDGSLLRWAAIFVLFAAVATAVWLFDWLVRTGRLRRASNTTPPPLSE